MGFWLPSAHAAARIHLTRAFHSPLRSALRVWLPSRRLTPLTTLPVLFRTGSTHGIRPSELSPLARWSRRFRPAEPTYRFSHECYRRRSERAGLAGRGSWALALTRVPGDRRGFKAPTAGCSLELYPFRAFRRQPWRGFRPASSHVLRPPTEADDPAPRSLNQLPLGLVRISAASRKRRTTQPS